ncbi:sigma-70 family RNA polymerase sigma factor [Aquipuribacter sp. SD81]|uniref:sigma-70 family RNA polymerase sigma factor n=1 Tax=Aquipuribacter sp. SD81 TaxID=3127703 RepID=UPI00301AA58A
MTQTLDAAAAQVDLDAFRGELTGYCYRMLGSVHDAEDAVQDTLVRAWRAVDRFEGRSSLRSWLYRIATNVCIDAIGSRSRRARPLEIGDPSEPVAASLADVRAHEEWLEPLPVGAAGAASGVDPAVVAADRESVRLAFVAALQHLPARQRAVLILRDVLRWRAEEVARLLEVSTASANSLLQRARATLAEHQDGRREAPLDPLDERHQLLLERYLDAFERYDIDAFVALLHADATQNMPPFAMWLRGAEDIGAWMLGPGHGCRGSRLVRTRGANGCPAVAQYRMVDLEDPAKGHTAWAVHVLEVHDGAVSGITSFLDTRLFPRFGLPTTLPAGAPLPEPGTPAGT